MVDAIKRSILKLFYLAVSTSTTVSQMNDHRLQPVLIQIKDNSRSAVESSIDFSVTSTVCQGINQRMRMNSIMAREISRTIQTCNSLQLILVQFHNILIAFRFVLNYYTAAGCRLTFGRILLQLNCGVKDFATCKLGLEPVFSKLLVPKQVYVASKGYA